MAARVQEQQGAEPEPSGSDPAPPAPAHGGTEPSADTMMEQSLPMEVLGGG